MKKILKEIQSGQFTKEWVKEYKGGLKNYNALLKGREAPDREDRCLPPQHDALDDQEEHQGRAGLLLVIPGSCQESGRRREFSLRLLYFR
jgi:hypothetical protein